MNGFVNTILSAMLSWIRALISNVWTMLGSEDGGAFVRFLSANWLTIVITLCAAGMITDVIVYFFRWRPDYVWTTRWRHLRRKRPRRERIPYEEPEVSAAYMRPQQNAAVYAPSQNASFVPDAADWQDPLELDEPVFDDMASWEHETPEEPLWEPEPRPAADNLAYFRDVQAGFAPAVPPEQLYTPAASFQRPAPADPEAAPVHPGLDDETFRQSLGLEDAPPAATPVMRAPVFRPFTVTHEPEHETRPQGALQRFAQRAREFVSMDDPDKRTTRELQSTVDVSKAFHEPVYPRSYHHDEE